MGYDYTGDSSMFPTPVTLPDLVDDATAASFATFAEPALDQLAFVNSHVPSLAFNTLTGNVNVTDHAAYTEVMQLTFPAGPGKYLFGMVVRAKLTSPDLDAEVGLIRLRSSSAFGVAGTTYTQLAFTLNHQIDSEYWGIALAAMTSTVTGTKLFLEAKWDAANVPYEIRFFPGTHIFSMFVGT